MNEKAERLIPPNIGEMLKKYAKEKRIFKAAWSRHQGVTKQTITRYFKKSTMQVSTLFDISQILKYNFIRDIADSLPADMPPHAVNPLQAELDEAKKDIERLKFQVEILEKMINK